MLMQLKLYNTGKMAGGGLGPASVVAIALVYLSDPVKYLK